MSQPAQYLGTGKRKTSVARVILRPGDGATWVNGRTVEEYFPRHDPPVDGDGAVPRRRARGPLRPPRPRPRRRAVGPGRRRAARHRPRARRVGSGAAHRRSSARASSPATPAWSSARRPACTRRARRRSSRSAKPFRSRENGSRPRRLSLRRWQSRACLCPGRVLTRAPIIQGTVGSPARWPGSYFGTDGVRGIVGETLTAELVERLGGAVTRWSGGGRIFVGRDTRGSGPELEEAFARGVAAAGGNAVLAGVLPTPAVALLGPRRRHRHLRLAQPARVQRRQDLRPRRPEAHRRAGGGDRGAARRPAGRRSPAGSTTSTSRSTATSSTSSSASAPTSTGLRIAVDCANGAYSGLAPDAFERLGAEIVAVGERARRHEHQRRLRRDRPRPALARVREHGARPRLRLRRRRRPDAGGRRARASRWTATS